MCVLREVKRCFTLAPGFGEFLEEINHFNVSGAQFL
jgi:hypothetical protein